MHFFYSENIDDDFIILEDEEMIPESFIEQHMTEKINVKKIKDELKKGQSVQGARLIQETRLDIK